MPSTGHFVHRPPVNLPACVRFFRRVNKHSQDGDVSSGKNHGYWRHTRRERRMAKVAVIEDDLPTSNQLKDWILSARPDITVEQWFTRDDAEAAIAREDYDLVMLDIELGRERHAGVAIINAINKGIVLGGRLSAKTCRWRFFPQPDVEMDHPPVSGH